MKNKKLLEYKKQLNLINKIASSHYYCAKKPFLNKSQIKINHQLFKNSPFKNLLHLHPYSGLLNDPNGLFFYDGWYYIFYQNVPDIAVHKMKNWRAYKTKDFIKYHDLGIIISPSNLTDKDGVFSGGALVYQNKIYLYYTGNSDTKSKFKLVNNEYTNVVEFNPQTNKISNKKTLFKVNKKLFTNDFRDPRPFYNDNDQKIYLFHGAQKRFAKKGAVALYSSSKPDKDFQYLGNIKFENDYLNFQDAYMFECPDFFRVGNKDVLSFSTQGAYYFGKNNQKRDVVVMIIGKMDFNSLTFKIENIQFADLGTEFYAPQSFNNTNQTIYLGWAASPEDVEVSNFKYQNAHFLNIPRIFELNNNKLLQKYHPFIKELIQKTQQNVQELKWENQPLLIQAQNNSDFELIIKNNLGDWLSLKYKQNTLTLDRSNMSYLINPESGLITTRNVNINNFEMILDKTYCQIFINGGEEVFSFKYFINSEVYYKFNNLNVTVNHLKGFNYDLENIFEPRLLVLGESTVHKFENELFKVEYLSGAGLSTATTAALINNSVYLASLLGKDTMGNKLAAFAKTNNINSKYLLQKEKVKTKTLNNNSDYQTIAELNLWANTSKDLFFNFEDNFDVLLINSNFMFLNPKQELEYLSVLKTAKQQNKLVAFKVNLNSKFYPLVTKQLKEKVLKFIRNSHIIQLSFNEFKLLFDCEINQFDDIIKENKWSKKIFLITFKEHGTIVFINKENTLVPNLERKYISHKATNNVSFGFFVALFAEHNFKLNNLKLKDIYYLILKANIAASLTSQKRGYAQSIPTLESIEKEFNKYIIKQEVKNV